MVPGYPDRPTAFPWALGLAGLRDVRDYKVASGGSSQLGTASPFNIKVGSFTLEKFTRDDVAELYGQHTEETGQAFEAGAIDRAWELSRGQPWLVNALARECVSVIRSDGSPVTVTDVSQAAQVLIRRMDTHLDSLAERLREPRVRAVMEPILAGRTADDLPPDDVRYALDLGLVRRSSEGGVLVSNPIYMAVIPRMLAYVTRLDPQHLPVAAVQFIQEHHLTGPVYNDYNFGGYLLWKAPELPVFVDGRIEVYQGRVLDDSLRLSGAAPGWEDLVQKYGVRLFLVRSDRTITKALLADPTWDLVYFDYNAAVFVPSEAPVAVRRLRVISPTGNRESAGSIDQAISEMSYLLTENPLFFGGFKVLAFLQVKRGDFPGAADSVRQYLALHPAGADVADTIGLIAELRERGAWSE